MVISRPGLLPETRSGSMVLLQLGSAMSVTHGAMKGHMDALDLGCILWSRRCQRAKIPQDLDDFEQQQGVLE